HVLDLPGGVKSDPKPSRASCSAAKSVTCRRWIFWRGIISDLQALVVRSCRWAGRFDWCRGPTTGGSRLYLRQHRLEQARRMNGVLAACGHYSHHFAIYIDNRRTRSIVWDRSTDLKHVLFRVGPARRNHATSNWLLLVLKRTADYDCPRIHGD